MTIVQTVSFLKQTKKTAYISMVCAFTSPRRARGRAAIKPRQFYDRLKTGKNVLVPHDVSNGQSRRAIGRK